MKRSPAIPIRMAICHTTRSRLYISTYHHKSYEDPVLHYIYTYSRPLLHCDKAEKDISYSSLHFVTITCNISEKHTIIHNQERHPERLSVSFNSTHNTARDFPFHNLGGRFSNRRWIHREPTIGHSYRAKNSAKHSSPHKGNTLLIPETCPDEVEFRLFPMNFCLGP